MTCALDDKVRWKKTNVPTSLDQFSEQAVVDSYMQTYRPEVNVDGLGEEDRRIVAPSPYKTGTL
jgi:hypothetical protein